MTRIKIPECSNPFEVTVNGRKYSYEAGIETDVPDEVAVLIEKHNKVHYKEAPKTVAPFGRGGVLHPLTLTGAVEAEYDGSQPLSVEIPEGENWITILDKEITVENASVIEEALADKDFSEYRAGIMFTKNTNADNAVNGNITLFVDGYRVAYYTISVNFDNYNPVIFTKIYPAVIPYNIPNNGGVVRNKKMSQTWTWISNSTASSGDYRSMVCFNSHLEGTVVTSGTLKIQMPSSYSGTVYMSVIARK